MDAEGCVEESIAVCLIETSSSEGGPNNEGGGSGSILQENDDPMVIQEHRVEEEEEPIDENDPEKMKDYVKRTLESTVSLMTSRVEKLEQQVLRVARFRSTLKTTRSQDAQSCASSREHERERVNSGNKKKRLLDAARSEAARRRRSKDTERHFSNILRQIMQHRWAWPFMNPVDVEGLNLCDYNQVIRKPMDLGSIRRRLEAKDGSGYKHIRAMCEDVRVVFRNAMMYNESSSDIYKMAKSLLRKFDKKWKRLIEPRLQEEEASSDEIQEQLYASEIAELHASDERAVENIAENVSLQLTDLEKQLECCILKVLPRCRAMTAEEKHSLGQSISQLSSSSLNRIVEIVARANNSMDPAPERVQIDLDTMDQTTLWRLYFFVKMIANSRKTS